MSDSAFPANRPEQQVFVDRTLTVRRILVHVKSSNAVCDTDSLPPNILKPVERRMCFVGSRRMCRTVSQPRPHLTLMPLLNAPYAPARNSEPIAYQLHLGGVPATAGVAAGEGLLVGFGVRLPLTLLLTLPLSEDLFADCCAA